MNSIVERYLMDCCPGNAFLTIHQLHPLFHSHLVSLEAEGGDTELGFNPRLLLPPPSPNLPPSCALNCTLLPGWQANWSSPFSSCPCHHVPDITKNPRVLSPRQSSRNWHYRGGGARISRTTVGRPRRILLPLRAHISALWPSALVLSNDSCRPRTIYWSPFRVYSLFKVSCFRAIHSNCPSLCSMKIHNIYIGFLQKIQ